MNLTGSPDYAAKILYIGDPGKGCSDNRHPVQHGGGDGPSYNSLGLESGRNILLVPRQNGGPVDRAQH